MTNQSRSSTFKRNIFLTKISASTNFDTMGFPSSENIQNVLKNCELCVGNGYLIIISTIYERPPTMYIIVFAANSAFPKYPAIIRSYKNNQHDFLASKFLLYIPSKYQFE